MEGSIYNGLCQIILKAALKAVPIISEENESIWEDKIMILLKLKGMKEALENNSKILSPADDMEIRVILLYRIDSVMHNKVVNSSNINSSKLLLQTINEIFASSQTANCAWVFNKFLYQQFKPDSIKSFITESKTSMKKMVDMRIDLPEDILAYHLLFKFPSLLHSLRQKIMHLDKNVTVNLVLNHLTQLENETQAKSKEVQISSTALITSNNSKKPIPKELCCTHDFHNPLSPDHNEDKFWHKHEHLAPTWWKEAQAKWRAQSNSNSKNKEVAHYHALLMAWIKDVNPNSCIILNSGASCHMFNSPDFFLSLTYSPGDKAINTGKEGA